MKKVVPKNIFYIGMFAGMIIWILSIFVTDGEWLNKTLYAVNIGFPEFSDFYGHIAMNSTDKNVYFYKSAVYPPLSEALYYVLGVPMRVVNNNDLWELGDSTVGSMVWCFYLILNIVLFIAAVRLLYKGCGEKEYNFLVITLLCSYPVFSYAIKTGNPIFLVVIFLMFAASFMESDSWIRKEAALILIAVSAAFKIFPALFGVIYLREKRYKEAVRLIIYGVLSFFVPFLFFEGMHGLKLFINNLLQDNGELICIGTLPWIVMQVENLIGYNWGGQTVVICLVAVLLIYGVMNVKEKWIMYALLCEMMLLIPGVSQPYSLIYLIIPLLLWLKKTQEDNLNKVDYLYALLFVLIFWSWVYEYTYATLWCLTILNIITSLCDGMSNLKTRK